MRNYPESSLQQGCCKWFALQYPKYKGLLIKISNEGKRTMKVIKGRPVCIGGAKWKAEGGQPGAADLVLALKNEKYNCLFIEMKYGVKTKQTPLQQEFQRKVEIWGNKYVICRNFDEFTKEIKEYLQIDLH